MRLGISTPTETGWRLADNPGKHGLRASSTLSPEVPAPPRGVRPALLAWFRAASAARRSHSDTARISQRACPRKALSRLHTVSPSACTSRRSVRVLGA